MNSFYSKEELDKMGFLSIGQNVLISKKVSIYGANKMSIGNNVRIDDYCIFSGKIVLGDYIHIAAYCGFYAGEAGIEVKDFSTTSSRVCIYAITDDYSGETMTNPMVDSKYKNIKQLKVVIDRHCIVGTNSTLLPGVELAEGVAVGAHSLVNRNCNSWTIYTGTPAKPLKSRNKNLLDLEKKFISEMKNIMD